jgi:hypothetical protein
MMKKYGSLQMGQYASYIGCLYGNEDRIVIITNQKFYNTENVNRLFFSFVILKYLWFDYCNMFMNYQRAAISSVAIIDMMFLL